MKLKLIILASVVLLGLQALGGTAFADNPHAGDGSATTDRCAGCHRAHRGQDANLLKSAQASLCNTCHDGTSSKLDVNQGIKTDVPTGSNCLRAGGFTTARLNTTDNGAGIGCLSSGQPVQSKHNVGAGGTIWGNGTAGSGVGPSFTLQCGDCHDVHGNGRYRVLKDNPGGYGATSVAMAGETPVTYTTTNYFDATYGGAARNFSAWCAQCHTRYLANASANPGTTARAGDAIFAYQHVSDGNMNTQCVICHTAHGSNAVSTGVYSGNVEWPGATPSAGTPQAGNSRMLKMDNRGICVKCHTEKK